MLNVYAMRVNLSVAMVAMVNTTTDASTNKTHQFTECSMLMKYGTQSTSSGFKGTQYIWDSKTQGIILGSFFYGYIITQLPGGILSEKYGAKWLFGCGVLVTAVLSLLTPLAASLGTGVFIAVRILEGLGEGVTFPAANVAISRWSPRLERSIISTIVFTGAQIGNVISMPVSGWLSSTDLLGGWPSVFYVFGTIGCIWFVLWTIFINEFPSQHPTITKDELICIQRDNIEKPCKKQSVPWKSVFTSLPMWAIIIAQIGNNFGFLILLTELPTYMSGILHFDIKADGLLSALPYFVQALSAWLVSFAADWFRKSGKMSITSIRKISNTIGLCGPGACLLGVTVVGCNPKATVALFSLAMALNGFIYSGFNVTHVDMSPDFAGTLFGITNAISNICGIIGPMIVGQLISTGSTLSNWSNVFYITATVYIICALFFAVFASAEIQPWGVADQENDVQNYKTEKIDLSIVVKN